MSEQNAKIKSTFLGVEDHGILTCFLNLEGDSWGVGFGGYALDSYDESKESRVGVAFGAEYVRRLLETLEVDSWEKLPGTIIRVDSEGWGGKTTRIGHALKDRWFNPQALAEEYRALEGGAR